MLERDEYAQSSKTWCKLNKPLLSEKEVDVTIFGIPYDKGVSYRNGAAQAPSMLRINTTESTPYTEQFEDFSTLTVFDAGDFIEEGRDKLFSEITNYVKKLVEAGIFFSVVGGDHSITIPVEAGVNAGLDEQFGIIHVDAHFDLCDELSNDKLSHGSVQRRALELSNIDSTENICFVGIRSIEADEYKFKQENKIYVHSAVDCHKRGVEQVAVDVIKQMKKYNKVYLTVDIDCLDPGFAAGTGTPQFGGLYSRQLLDFLKIIFEQLNIIGFDVVEVAPKLDQSLTSMFAARKIITELWGVRAKKINKLNK